MKKLITKDARQVTPGMIFCCFEGSKFDGHDFINQAIENGASAIYGTKDITGIDIYHQVDDINKTYTTLAQNLYDFETIKENMQFVGITGTDGKTTSALLLTQILNMHSSAAYLGTSGFIVGNKTLAYEGLTTPFAEDLYMYIKQAYDFGCRYFVMEVSSHALDQNRLGNSDNFNFAGVIMTNLTPEHLDYHHDMEQYLAAKLKILNYTNSNSKIVVNADDKYFYKTSLDKNIISYSCDLHKANYQVGVVSCDINGMHFYINHQEIYSNLIGEFNIYNLAGALILCQELGVNINDIKPMLNNLTIPGRMEVVRLKDNKNVIIDFAHTPDSIKKVLSLLKNSSDGRLIVVNGCAGERDSIKRPVIGKIMQQYCDLIILTTDDPRSERVEDINASIKSQMDNLNNVVEINDRVQAIEYGLKNLKANDVLVCLGKGGQNVQYMPEGVVNYSEQQVVSNLIKQLKLQ